MKEAGLTSTLNRLRLPLILGVVLIHCDILDYMDSAEPGLAVFGGFMRVMNVLFGLCVPMFFFISGYFFFRDGLLTRQLYLGKVKSRWHTLIIPYLAWNLIGLAAVGIKSLPPLATHFPQYEGAFSSVWSVLRGFYCQAHVPYPYDFPLWFLRDLIVLVVFAPVISFAFRLLRQYFVAVYAVVIVLLPCLPTIVYSSCFFFVLGATVSIYRIRVAAKYLRPLATTLLYGALVVASFYVSGPLMRLGRCLVGILWLISLSAWLGRTDKGPNKALMPMVFFIYACHGPYSSVVTKGTVMLMTPEDSSLLAFCAYFTVFAVNMAITLSLYAVGRRCFPRVVTVLTGNRNPVLP